ncbi:MULTISPECIES: alpha/beta hydrolase-fold protein [unclassified Aureimonas]|uniref:alpha/beta hydrolase-fold protein n=1 Tax=unclassified Aureimonas TaxID=2615206 RepID=UPI0006F61E8B|nr:MULTISPECIES: alpha/beta hydrolase-fold protein [unclassified Aureimonas]KQT68999.1 hypothetical protein ASG54_04900 [Aureimonas sp. Leaf460]KQT69229.1 hypothetical protein ASG62_17505 [Aureimonas sp. Leaf427]
MVRGLIVGAVALFVSTVAVAAPGDAPLPTALASGGARPVSLPESGAAAILPLDAAAGDYVAGAIDVSQGSVTLDLVAPDGHSIRRLGAEIAGSQDFHFVAGEGGERLRITAEEPARATLRLTRRLSPGEQVTPPAYLSARIAGLAAELSAGGTTDAFWAGIAEAGTPLIEPESEGKVVATFLQRGARRNVRLFGAPSGDHEALERLGASDVWFKSFVIPDTTRLSYQLAPDVPDLPGDARERRAAIVSTAEADPLNRHPFPADAPDAYNRDSLLELPKAPEQLGLTGEAAPAGSLETIRVQSALLGNERRVSIYRPHGFDPGDKANRLLVLFDREPYLGTVPTPSILDRLIAAGRLPPVVAVFVSSIDRETRGRELPDNPRFADFMALELMPLVRDRIGASVPPDRTILAGSSYGGLAAATVALRHPGVFGNVLSLSGSFWWHSKDEAEGEEHVADWIAGMPPVPVRFHLTAGLFETGHAGSPGILETTRHLRTVLRAKGYDVSFEDYAGGHDYVVWRGALVDGLMRLVQ